MKIDCTKRYFSLGSIDDPEMVGSDIGFWSQRLIVKEADQVTFVLFIETGNQFK